MNLRTNLRLPKEHGAWAMLYVPFVLGWLVAGKLSWSVLWLFCAVSALFISREALQVWWRARTRGRSAPQEARLLLVYLGSAALCGLPLLLTARLYWLLPLGGLGVLLLLINGKQATQLEARTVGSELLAIGGLTLTAPAAFYAARGVWQPTALWLWLLSALYFASSVFYIKLRIYRLNPRKQDEQRRAWQSCAVYHAFLLAALLALWLTGSLSLFVLVAFAPVLARSLWSLFKPVTQVNLRRAGFMEIGYSIIFLVCLALSFSAR
ncbi:MAG: YwiC-like family protein [Acidobacteria bacterium]|nr:YwiC-like family protein [Acidobacteriota bacterium]MBI3424796.1 YwiC-like family protein [Acidobacteriota bacterium]